MYVEKISNINFKLNDYKNYIDISVDEAWEFLTDVTNGIQYPIDVRTYDEWYDERINTPYPEYARLYSSSDLRDINGINNFKSIYSNKEVIIYCFSGGRSASAAQYLIDNNFNGTVYNMVGGITSWKDEGYPIKINNQIPNIPDIQSNSTNYYSNISNYFKAKSIDLDNDVLRYGWDWNGDDIIDEWTDYYQSEKTVNTSHKWEVPGNYIIKVLSEDIVGEKSDFSQILTINVSNLPPNKPEIFGTITGKKGETYIYNISSKDPNGDNIYFWILWHESYPNPSWDGPYKSSEIVLKNYSWDEEGVFNIKIKAKDTYDFESEWATLEVTMPIDKINLVKNYVNSLLINQINKIRIFKN
jgi:rhodanese-related sulfurtransferase